MFAGILAKIFGTNNARQLQKLQPIVNQINALEPKISALSDAELAAKTDIFREQLAKGKTLENILPEAFAVVRETSKRVLGQRHYDVQLLGGIVLHRGTITEMKTGEGKTLTSTLPLYLNALTGKGVHLVSVNDYLTRRDAKWMQPIYEFLGLTVAYLYNDMPDHERKQAYQADILYATNNELGFDYLRDNMKFRLEDYVQRDLNYAIIDEVDSILIDEARTPLIISGSTNEKSSHYVSADRAIKSLKKDIDYEVDEKERSVLLTESGNDTLEAFFNVDNLYAIENIMLLHHCKQALKAHIIFKRDIDYVVRDNEVLIVDEFTGRILSGRRYSDGLHQALEAKEGVEIEKETHTLASITLQNFFRLYKKLAGMTGTAMTESEEFYKIYKLHVISIPTNMPLIRQDKPDFIFLGKTGKYNAIVDDVKERYAKGQPVLIGTIAIETSELLSNILSQHNIKHEVLNAKQHQREAEIIELAGKPGNITIATNMAGRGTDIKLTPESLQAGGLYILGTERHESRRIDNQLRGRAGRQGDAGESRFYISLEDDLIRRFQGDMMKNRMQMVGMQEDEVIESPYISKKIEQVQEKVEKYNFDVRKNLIEYDDVLNQQRIVVYKYRREVLDGKDQIYGLVRDLIDGSVQDILTAHNPTRELNKDAVSTIFKELSIITGLPADDFYNAGISMQNSEQFAIDLTNFLLEKYSLYRSKHDKDTVHNVEKWLLLENIDQAWKQHMVNLDHLKEGISLRSWGQKNPLIEYKREAFAMFQDMMVSIRRDIVQHIFHLNIQHIDAHAIEKRREKELHDMRMISHESAQDSGQGNKPVTARREEKKVGRNDVCNCGSGKKFKKCCGAQQ